MHGFVQALVMRCFASRMASVGASNVCPATIWLVDLYFRANFSVACSGLKLGELEVWAPLMDDCQTFLILRNGSLLRLQQNIVASS